MAITTTKKKKKEKSFKFLNRFMLVQFALVLALCVAITTMVAKRAQQNANDHLSAIGSERMIIVENYVENAEAILNSFAKAPQFQKLLENPTDETLLKEAQEFTSAYAEGLAGLEGLYICDWNTKTLTHSTLSMAKEKKVLREEEASRTQLQKSIEEAGTKVYNTGVIKSPNTLKYVLSMYKGIYDSKGHAIGFAGFAVDTEDLLTKLSNMRTPGLENSIYALLDCANVKYIFADDAETGADIVLPDILNTINDVKGKTEDVYDVYEYDVPTQGSMVGTYEYNARRQWMLLMNAPSKQVYSLRNGMYMFMGIFTGLMVALMILFTALNKKQERVNLKLLSSMEKVKETRASLTSAMYNDILTDVGNRIKFSIDIDGSDGRTNPYYFALFNLADFSNINTQFGNDSGDTLLVRTAEILKEKYEAANIYRTGSDEFVVVFPTSNGVPRQESIIDSVNETLRNLVQPETVQGVGTIYPKFRVAVIKKTNDIDTSVVTVMKEMTKMKGEAVLGMIDFSDLSENPIG
jgi:GGDEF domain-containing protein